MDIAEQYYAGSCRDNRIKKKGRRYWAPTGDDKPQPYQRQRQQGYADPFAYVKVSVDAKNTLAQAHPANLIRVPLAPAGQALGSREHGQSVGRMEAGAVGQQINRKEE